MAVDGAENIRYRRRYDEGVDHVSGNGNVSIQTKNYPHPNDPDGVTEESRLYCEKCQASKMLEFLPTMFDETKLLMELGWAKGHKHSDGKVPIVLQDDAPTVGSGDRKLKVIQ